MIVSPNICAIALGLSGGGYALSTCTEVLTGLLEFQVT